jgi:hypothetical protein
MNEHIDLTFTGAKIAAYNNEAASTAIHGLSTMYNVGQMARFRSMYFQEQYAYLNGSPGASSTLMEQYRREMWKHTVLASIDILTLLIKGYSGMRAGR